MKLEEMSTLRKKDSGLPVNIYIDDSLSYKRGGHSKRIKFQTDMGNKPVTSSFATMKLNGELVEKTIQHLEISQKEINEIRNFVINNKECLSLVADMDLDYITFVNSLMIPGGEKATEEQKEQQKQLLKEYLGNINDV